MILTENHKIKRSKHSGLFKTIDAYCYCAKNLSNSIQYLICQCYRIHQKQKKGELPDSWEQELIDNTNNAITAYNDGRDEKKRLKLIDANNGFVADAYFLSWHMKTREVYRAMPYATCSQICIQEKCRQWKSFYQAQKEYTKNPDKFFDGELPEKIFHDATRRVKRGMFKSNKGTKINADVNAAYQIIKAGGYKDLPIKEKEKVTRRNVA